MSSAKTYSEVCCLIKNEIESIRRRDGGLAPTAYVVVEVASRLKTIQPWVGYNHQTPLCQNIRGVVEEILKGKLNLNRVRNAEDKDMDVIWISSNPYENLEDSLGDAHLIGRSVDSAPVLTKRERLKKKLKVS